MNNIYVETMPETCEKCPCYLNRDYYDDCKCNFTNNCVWVYALKFFDCSEERHPTCPLKPLSDRLAEERKKVEQEFKEKIIDGTSCEILPTGDICISLEKINNVLDQIERGEICVNSKSNKD